MFEENPYFAGFTAWEQMITRMYDMWLIGMGSWNWTQSQMENALRIQLNQYQAAMSDLTIMAGKLGEQVNKNQIAIVQALEDAIVTETKGGR